MTHAAGLSRIDITAWTRRWFEEHAPATRDDFDLPHMLADFERYLGSCTAPASEPVEQGAAVPNITDCGQGVDCWRCEEEVDHTHGPIAYPQPLPPAPDGERIQRVTMDFPQAWEFVRGTDKKDHHRKCSWRTYGMLCDCSVLNAEYLKRAIEKERADHLAHMRRQREHDLRAVTDEEWLRHSFKACMPREQVLCTRAEMDKIIASRLRSEPDAGDTEARL